MRTCDEKYGCFNARLFRCSPFIELDVVVEIVNHNFF